MSQHDHPLPRLLTLGLGASCAALLAGPAAAFGGGFDFEDVPSMLYAWDGSIAIDWKETKDLVKYAKNEGYQAIVFEASAVGYDPGAAFNNYQRLIARAHEKGVEVYALVGHPWFTVGPDVRLPGQPTSTLEGWMVIENLVASGLEFDGIVDNSMPYLTDYSDGTTSGNYFWDTPALAGQDYLDYLRGAKERAAGLPFHHTIPFWFDIDPRLTLVLDGEPEEHPLNWYVQGVVDVAHVLAYRDVALGPGGIVAFALGEMLTGPCMVGLETQDLGPDLAYLTFWEEGAGYLGEQLTQTWAAFEPLPNFGGFSIHNYHALIELED